MATTTAIQARKVTNYRSQGGKIQVIDEIPVNELLDKVSRVLRNVKGTPYIWLNDGSPEGSVMVYMSKKASALAEELQDQLSKSRHAIQVWEKESQDEEGKATTEEFYVVSLTGEVVEAGEATFAD